MANREMRVRLMQARDHEINWKQNNPVLYDGELAVVYGSGDDPTKARLKVGDGNTAYKDLPFIDNGGSSSETKIVISDIPQQLGVLIYNGSTQMPVWVNYDSDKLIMSGTTAAQDAGSYITLFYPASGYCWDDQSTGAKSVSWEIQPQPISLTTLPIAASMVYTGAPVSPVQDGYSNDLFTISGDMFGVDAGEYTVILTPTKNGVFQED